MTVLRFASVVLLGIATVGCGSQYPSGPTLTRVEQVNPPVLDEPPAIESDDRVQGKAVPVVTVALWALRAEAVVSFATSCGGRLWNDVKKGALPSSTTVDGCIEWGTNAAASAVSGRVVKALPKVKVSALRESTYRGLKPVFGRAVTWAKVKGEVNKKTLPQIIGVLSDLVLKLVTEVDDAIRKACANNGVTAR